MLQQEVHITDDMTAAEAGRTIVARHLGQLLASEPGTVEGRDPEPLHQMRVATRRLRAALRAFGDAYPAETVDALGHEVRWLAGLLGRVRDLDVLAEALDRYERKRGRRRPPMAWAQAEVQERRADERLVLLEGLGSARYLVLKRSLAEFSAASSASGGDDLALRSRAERDIRHLLQAVRRAGKRAQWSRPDSVHVLRIAAKRLRYTMEFYRDLFPAEMSASIDAATAVQDHLGSMRDAELQAQRLLAICAKASRGKEERQALDGFLRHLRRRARKQHEAFAAVYPSLTSPEAVQALKALLRGVDLPPRSSSQ